MRMTIVTTTYMLIVITSVSNLESGFQLNLAFIIFPKKKNNNNNNKNKTQFLIMEI